MLHFFYFLLKASLNRVMLPLTETGRVGMMFCMVHNKASSTSLGFISINERVKNDITETACLLCGDTGRNDLNKK